MELKYYVYYHVRLDKNHVFYVGVGTKNKRGSGYRRANNGQDRNILWKRIVNKTKYEVIILKHFPTKLEALVLETRLIKLFGIISEGGQLANIIKDTVNEFKEVSQISASISRKPVYQYSMNGDYLNEYTYLGQAADEVKGNSSSISQAANGKIPSYKGFQWRYFKTNKIEAKLPQRRKVYQYDLEGNFIKEWNSISEAGTFLNTPKCNIWEALPGGAATTAGNYQWRREKFDNLKPVLKHSPRDKFKKLIYQYDKDYTLINTFHGTSEIKRVTGISGTQIYRCCMKEKNYVSAGGYFWSYDLLNK